MKIVVIGGSGLIGKKLVPILREHGHEAVSASPSSGVNAVTGEGLAEALAGANVVVDVSNSPSWADDAVMEFFDTSTRNLLAAEKAAGVGHHVALSVVGADRMPDSGYMRAKVHQERLIEAGGVPYTIVRATQFFEFLGGIAGNGRRRQSALPTAPMQPLAADDVAAALADIALEPPANGMVEVAGPESLSIADFVGRYLAASGDKRTVVADPEARYFGAALDAAGLNPGANPRLGPTRFEDWFRLPGECRPTEAAVGEAAWRHAMSRWGMSPRYLIGATQRIQKEQTMSVQEKRARFRALHERGCFVLPNPWDVGSARLLQHLGFSALASTSSGFAWTTGRPDYGVGLSDVLGHLTTLCAAVDIPVNADFESGFASEPECLAENVRLAVATGVAGLSVEDRVVGEVARLYDASASVERDPRRTRGHRPVGRGRRPGRAHGRLVDTTRVPSARPSTSSSPSPRPWRTASLPGREGQGRHRGDGPRRPPKPLNVLVMGADLSAADLAELGVRRISVGGALRGSRGLRCWRRRADEGRLLRRPGGRSIGREVE